MALCVSCQVGIAIMDEDGDALFCSPCLNQFKTDANGGDSGGQIT